MFKLNQRRSGAKLADIRPRSSGGTVALCDRCGEAIALANDIDHAGHIDRRRHRVQVDGKARFADHDAVADIHAALPEPRRCGLQWSHPRRNLRGSDQASTHLITEHMRLLGKVLADSRYQIANYRNLGYVLAVADDAASVRPPEL